jgi:outer membrane protein insertion porin family
MSRTRCFALLLLAVFLPFIAQPITAQSLQPKTIQFKGDPDHTDAELTEAAGLKKGATLTEADLNDSARRLMDTGLFEDIHFNFNGTDLVFQIVPANDLYPLRLENFPPAIAAGVDAKLRARLPLYRGKIPLSGPFTESVRSALIEELAAKDIQATIEAAPYSASGKVVAVSLAITSPEVRIGELRWNGDTSDLAPKARILIARAIGSAYSIEGSRSLLEKSLVNFYGERGYLEVTAIATPSPDAEVDPHSVSVPFDITVDPGPQYKLAAIRLSPEIAVSQAEFDKQSGLRPGGVASLVVLRSNWEYLVRQFHNRGFMKAEVTPTPTFDRAQQTVSYLVTAVPGPVYNMGTLRIDNVTDELRGRIQAALKMPPGSVFNEGAVIGMTATHDVDPVLERFFPTMNMRYSTHLHDDTHTVDLIIILEKK